MRALTIALLFAASSLSGQTTEPKNQVFLGLVAHEYSGGSEGRETSLEWLRQFSPDVRLSAGGTDSSIEDTRWRFGRMGLMVSAVPRTQLYVEGSFGKGTAGTRDFLYRINRGGVTVALVKDTLFADIEEQYIHVDRAKGNVGRLGLALTPRKTLRLGMSFHKSIDGNLDARYVSGRADWTIDRTTLLAGFSKGRTRPEMFQIFDDPQPSDSNEFFAGVGVPVARQTLTLIFSSLEFEDVKRHSLLFNWRVPF